MRVVWASDRDWNGSGGAEMADREMVSRRPDDVDLTIIAPGFMSDGHGRHQLQQAEQVVVSGIQRFSAEEVALLASTRPLVWAHDLDTLGHPIHGLASTLVCLTPMHQKMEQAALHRSEFWSGPRVLLCPGWLDTTVWDDPKFDVPAEERDGTALFAHRPTWSKNLVGASAWAKRRGVPLRVMMGRPREDVLDAMATSRYFVLLSHIIDPGPLSVIEAQLSGCELVVNELVGYYNLPREDLKLAIAHQDTVFWSLVKGES